MQSHGNLKRTKSFTPCSSPTETSFPLPSASSFSVPRSKSDPRKYENQKRIIQYLPYLNPEIVIQSRIFRAAHRPDGKQDKPISHGSPKQPDNDSFCGKASFCSTFLQRNRSAGHKANAESGIRPNNLCPCFCAGILLSRSFDARDAPNKPYFQRKLTDSLSNLFNALPAIFCTAEVLSLLLLRKLQLHSITAIRKLKCTNPLKKQPAVNAAHKGFGTQNTPNATAFCSSRSPMPFLNPNPLSQKTANSAGFKTGRNAAITQSKRNATLLFEAQFAFSNSVPHFFSLPHMMFILCFWRFLRF